MSANYTGKAKNIVFIGEAGSGKTETAVNLALLMAAEGETQENFAPVKCFYEALVSNLGWQNRGIVYAGGNFAPGAILQKTDQLQQAEELGKHI